jgi:hypothetical protein
VWVFAGNLWRGDYFLNKELELFLLIRKKNFFDKIKGDKYTLKKFSLKF